MQFEAKQRVNTPQGPGFVNYQRLAAPDYRDAIAVSVKLDSRSEDLTYIGNIFPADQVTLIAPIK